MTAELLYLKQNVLVEPLVGQWYAWPYLIAPATAALYVANAHLKIMRSFVAAPQVHVAAVRNPALLGGPYVNYGAERLAEIEQLIVQTLEEQTVLLELAAAIAELEALLRERADGHSLESLYSHIPAPLKGYVELVYDLGNQPTFRIIEGLLYTSGFYQPGQQSFLLSLIEQDQRPFVLNTPRLPDGEHLHLKLPFAHPAVDALFQMRTLPQPLEETAEKLGLDEAELPLFASFLTSEPPPEPEAYSGPGLRIRYFGHACLLVESQEVAILVDPLISYRYDSALPRYTYADLPPWIDYVLITHNHQDHCILETLLQLRHKIRQLVVPRSSGGNLADPSLKLILQHSGFDRVMELDEMEAIKIPEGTITGLPFFGEHADLNIRTKLAYHLNIQGRSLLCAADSNNLEPQLYEHVHALTGDLDALFVGMECDGAPLSWLYGALLTRPLARKMDQSRRLNGSDFEKALAIVEKFRPRAAYVYAMGQEPWLTHLTSIQYTERSRPIVESEKLLTGCREQNIAAERLFGCKEIFM